MFNHFILKMIRRCRKDTLTVQKKNETQDVEIDKLKKRIEKLEELLNEKK